MLSRKIADVLKDHEFFRGMKEPDIDFIAGCAANVNFRARDTVFCQGDPADHFYLIRSGKVAIDIESRDGRLLTIQTLGEDKILGWSWIFPPYTWQFSARAVETTRAIALDARCLRGKCEENPALGYELMKRFSAIGARRLQRTRMQILDMFGGVGFRADVRSPAL